MGGRCDNNMTAMKITVSEFDCAVVRKVLTKWFYRDRVWVFGKGM